MAKQALRPNSVSRRSLRVSFPGCYRNISRLKTVEKTMQTNALMPNDPFDMLTVALGSAVSLRERLRLIGTFLTSQIFPFSGGPPPSAIPKQTSRPCIEVDDDGTCYAGVKTARSGYTPGVNGCGAASGLKFPNGYGAGNWRWACDQHDRCYADCATPRETCDSHIELGITSTCTFGYQGF